MIPAERDKNRYAQFEKTRSHIERFFQKDADEDYWEWLSRYQNSADMFLEDARTKYANDLYEAVVDGEESQETKIVIGILDLLKECRYPSGTLEAVNFFLKGEESKASQRARALLSPSQDSMRVLEEWAKER